jgi:hypothetical protein
MTMGELSGEGLPLVDGLNALESETILRSGRRCQTEVEIGENGNARESFGAHSRVG